MRFSRSLFSDGRKSSNVVSGRQRPEVTSKTSRSGREIQFDRGNCWRVTMLLHLVRRNRSANREQRPEEGTKKPCFRSMTALLGMRQTVEIQKRNSQRQGPKRKTPCSQCPIEHARNVSAENHTRRQCKATALADRVLFDCSWQTLKVNFRGDR